MENQEEKQTTATPASPPHSRQEQDDDVSSDEGEQSESETPNDSTEVTSQSKLGMESGTEQGTNVLDRLRREKRLAMNRESARLRRRRKKAQMQTLEKQVADLTELNQRYHLANEQLKATVRQLENDLSLARSTISMLSNQSQMTTGHGATEIDAYSSNLGLGAGGNSSGSGAAPQDSLRRLLQAQSESLSQQGGSALNLGRSLMNNVLMRRRALEMQMLSQTGRGDLAMGANSADGSILGRIPQGIANFSEMMTSSPGLHPQSIQNTLAMPLEMGLGNLRASLGGNNSQTTSLMDAVAAPNQDVTAHMINEMLKQQQQNDTFR